MTLSAPQPNFFKANYGFTFGEHLWLIKITRRVQGEIAAVVGVTTSTQRTRYRVHGYHLRSAQQEVVLKLLLDANRRQLKIWPQNSLLEQDVCLPFGEFTPAIQLSSAEDCTVEAKFDLPLRKKVQIAQSKF
jgi:transcription initiation factor TFIIIB Brf1 subunit/transcription initiation factor TFIIB